MIWTFLFQTLKSLPVYILSGRRSVDCLASRSISRMDVSNRIVFIYIKR